jgi:hypothetical protein
MTEETLQKAVKLKREKDNYSALATKVYSATDEEFAILWREFRDIAPPEHRDTVLKTIHSVFRKAFEETEEELEML